MKNGKSIKSQPVSVLVSACLLGIACRYDGESKPHPLIIDNGRHFSFVPFCPETYGGLQTPRVPAECQPDGRVLTKEGLDVTAAYAKGAAQAVAICRDFHIDYAILKSRSPSCGVQSRYDGSFSGTLIDAPGVTAQALMDAGVQVISDEDFEASALMDKAQSHLDKGANTMYVAVEEGSCVGCGSCAAICEDVFAMTDLGTARATKAVTAETLADVKDAIKMCPVNCIFWDED